MEYALIGVIGIATIVAVSIFAGRLGLAAPLILVLVGVGYSFIPGVPPIHITPNLILEIVLPPLLYAAAIQVPIVDFRRNLGSITILSVTLVIVTTLVIGFFLYLVLPKFGLPPCFAIGAIVSPTDAVAATAVAKRLGLPTKLVSLLEGESLVNDASALVLLRVAVAAIALGGSSFHLGEVTFDFALAVVVALVIGFATGIVTVFVRAKLTDSVFDTAISFVVPFVAFIPTELLGASGVLAVVVAGLYSGARGSRVFSVQSRMSERINWRTIQFILENGVFLFMGLQLKTIVTDGRPADLGVGTSIGLGLAVVVILLLVRAAVVFPMLWRMSRNRRQAMQMGPRLEALLERVEGRTPEEDARRERRFAQRDRMIERRSADIKDLQDNAIDWRGGIVMVWAGMRGVVTVAAAQTLPADTPFRPQLILLAFTVAIVTLLGQGLSLPAVIRWTKITGSDRDAVRRELGSLLVEMESAGEDLLDNPDLVLPNGQKPDQQVLDRLKGSLESRTDLELQKFDQPTVEDAEHIDVSRQYQLLRWEVLEAQRAMLLEAKSKGSYSSRIVSRAETMLDVEEARLQMGND
jgi:CPA1 family monovalent cation:H+ antiporter